jgi:transposase
MHFNHLGLPVRAERRSLQFYSAYRPPWIRAGFRRRYRAGGHGRAAFDPEMIVALLLYGCCQGERSSRVIEKRCVRDAGYRVITGGLRPDHATVARFRVRHETALGGLFSQVLRLLAAEGMVQLGLLSLDGTKLAGNAAQKANKTLPQTGQAAGRGGARRCRVRQRGDLCPG